MASMLNFLPTLLLLFLLLSTTIAAPCSKIFREYIGAELKGVRFSDVPVNPDVNFHFILSFAIDDTTFSAPSSTNGRFNVFWDTDNLTSASVAAIKNRHANVKVALSLGGDSVSSGDKAYFQPSSVESWVNNAVSSLTNIIKQYNLDGVDVDYEHFHSNPQTFAECNGQLLTTLKNNRVISFASIAPYDHEQVQSHYLVLWRKYGLVIDYVNFQFYAYDASTTVTQFLRYYEKQSQNYTGGKILASIATDGSGGLSPNNGFFSACNMLKMKGRLPGIFIWPADDSKTSGFPYEKRSQNLLASKRKT